MEIVPKQPSAKGPAERFTGDVWMDPLARAGAPGQPNLNLVRFAPGARTAWHAHGLGQTLYVTEGRGRIQSRGAPVVEVRAGDVIYTPDGEEHWHGAAPEHVMAHLSITQGDATWGEHVTDDEYRGRPG